LKEEEAEECLRLILFLFLKKKWKASMVSKKRVKNGQMTRKKLAIEQQNHLTEILEQLEVLNQQKKMLVRALDPLSLLMNKL
jgi:hypothetical protein